MENPKDHLNIDLEFLDKKEPLRVSPEARHTTNSKPSQSTGQNYNLKNVLIAGGVILFFIWAAVSDDTSSTNTSTNTGSASVSNSNTVTPTNTDQNNDNVIIGEYSCPRYYANQADTMKPSEIEKQMIDTEQAELDSRTSEIERLGREIKSTYVDQTDQDSIDNYNEIVRQHNVKLTAYKKDIAPFNKKIDQYNAVVDKYNNYLETNCTKVR